MCLENQPHRYGPRIFDLRRRRAGRNGFERKRFRLHHRHTQGLLTTTPGALQSKSCGSDCSFVTELSQDGTGLIYSTFLGGNAITQASSIALDPSGSVWVAGVTTSTDFPSPSRQAGAFVVKINASGTGITGSLLFGGGFASLLGFDELGNAYVSGTGTAGAFSVTPNALLSAPCSPSAGAARPYSNSIPPVKFFMLPSSAKSYIRPQCCPPVLFRGSRKTRIRGTTSQESTWLRRRN
ncbi:MAG: hypothetical protein DMG57_05395 [Acidobacteria bacterium]|nr:MAG: hypothetical protein DMG57_05395 [Acidobacteriota bacterium]